MSAMPRGAIIAVVDMVDYIPAEVMREWMLWVGPNEAGFGDYTPGRWAWRFRSVRPLSTPIPCRGWQRLWTVQEDIAAQVRAQVRLG